MSTSSSSSSSGSIISSMDSAHEELQSLRKSTTNLDQLANARKSFFDLTKKSLSTNSSPLKKNVYVTTDDQCGYKPHDAAVLSGNGSDGSFTYDEDDIDEYDEYDSRSLGFDPFVENTDDQGLPIANSTVLSNLSGNRKKQSKPKSVRFYDWEKTLNEEQLKILKAKMKQFGRGKPLVKGLNTKGSSVTSELQFNDRAPSSEYSNTPDTTEVDKSDDKSATLTATQKLYILQEDSFGEKKSSLKRSDLYTPLTDLTKTPKIVKSSAEPIVSASTDQSSLFSKSDTITEPTATCGSEQAQPQEQLTVPLKSKSKFWGNFPSFDKVNKKWDDFQNETLTQTNSKPADISHFDINAKTPDKKQMFGGSSEESSEERPFSFRLQRLENIDCKKPSSQESADESYDQVDILEQSPPQLPGMEKSNPIKTVFQNHNESVKDFTLTSVNDNKYPGSESEKSNVIRLESEIQEQIKLIIETLAHTSDTPLVIDDGEIRTDYQFKEKISQIEGLSRSCDKRVDNLKIQLIKFTKQIKDHDSIVKDKVNYSTALHRKLQDAVDKIESLGIECSRFENKVASQLNIIHFERQSSKGCEKELLSHKKLLSQIQNDLEKKELYVENITRLVRNHYLDHELDLMDEDRTLEALKELLSKLNQLNDISKNLKNSEKSLKSEISLLNEKIGTVENENILLKRSLNSSKDQNTKYQTTIELKDKQLEEFQLENENYNNLLKSLECSYTNIKTQLENEKFRTKELELKIQEMQAENELRNKKTSEMEKVLSDQLSLINDAHHEIEGQSSEIRKLSQENHAVKEINTQLISNENVHKEEITKFKNDLYDSKVLNDELAKSKEETERRLIRVTRSKDDDIVNLKRRVNDLEAVERNLASELKETRSRLSEKFAQSTSLEKKVGNLTNDLKEANENNRILRSKVLHNNSSYQDLKRALVALSISIVRDLDGIIDDDSLSAVKEDISNENNEKQLQKLHDISIFIEEAVSLIVKEYWSLTKRLSDSQKGSLSNNSLSALQLIIESQNERLKQLRTKLAYYESIFKKINKANAKSSAQQRTSSTRPSTSRSVVNNDTRRVRIQAQSDASDLSTDTAGSIYTRPPTSNVLREKKEDEINRLLSKIRDDESGSNVKYN